MNKIVSIDIESSGLNPEKCQILEFAAVIDQCPSEDVEIEDLPFFHTYLWNDELYFESSALEMHQNLLQRILYIKSRGKLSDCNFSYNKESDNLITPNKLSSYFSLWLSGHGLESDKYFHISGKNFSGFDRLFLRKLPGFLGTPINLGYRFIDPALLYFDPENDSRIPSLQTCLERAGYSKKVNHAALEDARDVLRVLRYAWSKEQIISLR